MERMDIRKESYSFYLPVQHRCTPASEDIIFNNDHHHHVPSSCQGLDAMVLHSWWCCACLTAWWYSSPIHLVMFVVHFVLGLPRPLEPFTFPSKTVRCSVSPFWRMMCPKYCSFFCLYDVV